jgi:hypothetical protein
MTVVLTLDSKEVVENRVNAYTDLSEREEGGRMNTKLNVFRSLVSSTCLSILGELAIVTKFRESSLQDQ